MPESQQGWLIVRLDRAVYSRLQGSAVRISGKAMVSFYRREQTTWMPIGVTQAVAAAGHCTGSETEDYSGGGLKVVCESPASIPRHTSVRIVSTQDGREWSGRSLGD